MDRDRLIAEIAREHGIRLDQEDPIVVAAMINERLLEEAAAALRRNITAAADQLSAPLYSTSRRRKTLPLR